MTATNETLITSHSVTGTADSYVTESTRSEDYSGIVIVVSVQLAVFAIIGLFGNGLLLVTLIRKARQNRSKSHRKIIPNIMLIHLTLGDLFVLVFCIPLFYMVIHQAVQTILLCKLLKFTTFTMVTHAHLLLTIGVPVERYIAICCNTRTFGRKWLIGLHFGILLASICIALPEAFLSELVSLPLPYGHLRCDQSGFYRKVIIAKFFTMAAAPLLIFAILYGLILRKILASRKALADFRNHTRATACTNLATPKWKQFAKDTRLVYMMFVVSAIYFLTWVPNVVHIIYREQYLVTYVFQFVFLFNNASNFIVFGLMSPKMRWEMLATLGLKKKSRNEDSRLAPVTV